jgi:hypothetical protein
MTRKNLQADERTGSGAQVVGIVDPNFDRTDPRHRRVFVSVLVRDGVVFGNANEYEAGGVEKRFGFEYKRHRSATTVAPSARHDGDRRTVTS